MVSTCCLIPSINFFFFFRRDSESVLLLLSCLIIAASVIYPVQMRELRAPRVRKGKKVLTCRQSRHIKSHRCSGHDRVKANPSFLLFLVQYKFVFLSNIKHLDSLSENHAVSSQKEFLILLSVKV